MDSSQNNIEKPRRISTKKASFGQHSFGLGGSSFKQTKKIKCNAGKARYGEHF
jgi:hypothetical protein